MPAPRGQANGGSGGSRTLVRTRKPYAFYTLILDFGFRAPARPKPPTAALAPKLHPCIGACRDYFRFNLRHLIFGFGTRSSERRPVLLPCKRIKPVIYYTSIRQREHTHCCQLILRRLRLRREPTSLRVLTYHLDLPSNPVTPGYADNVISMQRYGFLPILANISRKKCNFAPFFALIIYINKVNKQQNELI